MIKQIQIMTDGISGNLLVMQSGVAGVVGNAALYGVIVEALNYEDIDEVYGVYNGFNGLQSENFIDLASLSQQTVKLLLSTAGHALKSESSDFSKESQYDFSKIVGVLKKRNIKFLCCIGDKASILILSELSACAKAAGYELRIVAIPQSNLNDLPVTDHSLGYGSYIKYVNAHLAEFDYNLRTSGGSIGICEVSGGSAGWVVAGCALSKGKNANNKDNPFIVCLPEQPLDEELLIAAVRERIKSCGYALVVTNHCLVDENGEYISFSEHNGSAASYINTILSDAIGTNAIINFCSMKSMPVSHFMSKQDQNEALSAGKESVCAIMAGKTDCAAVLSRRDIDQYDCEINFVPMHDISTGTKFLPIDWIVEASLWINFPFVRYASPLVLGEVETKFEKGIPQLISI